MFRLAPFIVAFASLAIACSSSTTAGVRECIPGVVLACECEDGSSGTTSCRPNRPAEACSCEGSVPGAKPDPTGEADLLVEFGAVPVGDRAFAAIPLRHPGPEELVLQIGETGAPFRLESEESVVLEPGQRGELRWSFAPVGDGLRSTVVSIDSGGVSFAVRLVGQGFEPVIDCEERVDFGEVEVGRDELKQVRCFNLSREALEPVVGPLGGNDPEAFTVASPVTGPVPPDGSWLMTIGAVPKTGGLLQAVLPIKTPGGRELVLLPLEAKGVLRSFRCEGSLDFGYVAPGSSARRQLVCTNSGATPVRVFSLALDASSRGPFSWSPNQFPQEVPARTNGKDGTLTIDVVLAPKHDEPGRWFNGLLVLTTDYPPSPRADFPLSGHTGGPKLSCDYSSLDFGKVLTGQETTRTLRCANSGERLSSADDRLQVWGFEGVYDGGFTVSVAGGIDQDGYEVGESFTIEVTYSPRDAGYHANRLKISSNATNLPVAEPLAIGLYGEAVDMGNCFADLVPAALRFGNVAPGSSRTLEFAIRNRSADNPCLVQRIRLASNCHESYSVRASETDTIEIPPTDELLIAVDFEPAEYGASPHACDVLFDIPNSDEPHRQVLSSGVSMESCLQFEPETVDFGSYQPGCTPPSRQFQIRNICDEPVRVGQVEVVSAGGEFVGSAYVGVGEEVPPYDQRPLLTVSYQPPGGRDLAFGTVFASGVGEAEPISAALVGGGALPGSRRTDTFFSSTESCFLLLARPKDVNGDGAISDAEGELEVELNDVVTPSATGEETVWSYTADTNSVCFEEGFVPAKGTRVEISYRTSCFDW